jgi:hypothetical protein
MKHDTDRDIDACVVVYLAGIILCVIMVAMMFTVAVTVRAQATDNGWEDTSPQVRRWFQSLMQPDAPMVSCCGEADAYESDEFEIDGDHYVAIITDTRGDTFKNGMTRPHIEPGTRISIPNGKMKWDQGNPTGHGYVFIGQASQLYCYITPAGI